MGAIRSGRGRRAARSTALVAALVSAAAILVAGCGERGGDASLDSLPGAIYDPPRPAPALWLREGGCGGRFDLANERGHVVLVFFGFTQCPDICPATLTRWKEVRASLGADTSRVRFVFVSIDPEIDTPEVASAYARQFHPSFVGLSGTPAEVAETALAWGVSKETAHTTQVFVVDPKGQIPWGYGRSATTEEIVRGIRAVGARGAPN